MPARNVLELRMSLTSLDAEIRRVSLEIAHLQAEAERSEERALSLSPKKKFPIVPEFKNLPNCVDPPIPTAFQRAPITCPFDASKALKMAELEREAKQLLTNLVREDCLAVLHRVHKHQAAEMQGGQSEEVSAFPQYDEKVLSRIASEFLIPGVALIKMS